ncbi:hypothetical protein J2W23_005801 [Variovorax boronicumulans]|uniref:hypothetical protein n=1 Tax=Variovorax boronicumulans TaxID=436515 RepID=UPI00159D7CD4|nr:hypothetical protein [Variovorax boronicumulans]MDQ0017388.1 hypothetical protein [Variovorax boronicumulans]
MRTRYIFPKGREIKDFWHVDRKKRPTGGWKNLLTVFPLSMATFSRRSPVN